MNIDCTAQVIAAGVDGSGRVSVDLTLHGPDGSILGEATIWPRDLAVSVDAAHLLFQLHGLRILVEPNSAATGGDRR